MSERVEALLTVYLVVLGIGAIAVVVAWSDDALGLNRRETELAKIATVTVLWPLALGVAAALALAFGIRALGRSYVALWRSWRPRRRDPDLPAARAREVK